MNPKKMEPLGLKALKGYLVDHLGISDEHILDVRNSGKKENRVGCDLILKLNGKKIFMELKASGNDDLPTNIKFTHQTIASMYNEGILQDLVVAYVYNLNQGMNNAKFKFFRFGDIPVERIYVEPHFIVQPKALLREQRGGDSRIYLHDDINSLLNAELADEDISILFVTPVSRHMKLKTGT
ncbi:MAG: hypothetical protein KAV83_10340 [Desulfobacterales bacterium]|nr:hypothetical protein [Desulfobacterales bacterium]